MRQGTRFSAVGCPWLIATTGLVLVAAFVWGQAAPARAQEPKAAAEEKAAPDEEAAPAAPDEPLVVQQPTEPEEEPDPSETKPVEKTYLEWLYESLGISYSVAFLFLSFTLVALLIMDFLTARRESILPTPLVQGFEKLLNEQKYQEAYDLAKGDESMLGQVLSAGLAKLSRGYDQAIEGMQEVGEEENMKLEHRLSYVALIAVVSPMVGLLGTVDGMTSAFQTIAISATAPKPAALAGNISTALVTTLVGLMIAIPAIAAHTILRNRIARLVLEVGILSENLMSRFSNVGGKKN